MDARYDLLQNIMGRQLQEILEYMQYSDVKKGKMIDYKKLEEHKRRAERTKYEQSKQFHVTEKKEMRW